VEEFAARAFLSQQTQVQTDRDKSLAVELYAGLDGDGAIRKHFLRNAEF
jgi:hypothetical protein